MTDHDRHSLCDTSVHVCTLEEGRGGGRGEGGGEGGGERGEGRGRGGEVHRVTCYMRYNM